MNCENDLIVCIDNSNYIKNKNNTDKNNERFKNLINDIRNYKKLTEEKLNFIKILQEDKKLEIILEYDKIAQSLIYTVSDLISYKNIR